MTPWEEARQARQRWEAYNEENSETQQDGTVETTPWDEAKRSRQGPEETGYIEDTLKGAGSGILRGIAGLAGVPGSINNLMDDSANWLYEAATGNEGSFGKRPPLPADANALTRMIYNATGGEDNTSPLDIGSMRNYMSGLTGGFSEYEPEHLPGKIAQTGAEMSVGAAALRGPAMGKKLLPYLVKYGFMPGAASELAGQATEGTPYEPYARTGAALLTPSLMNGRLLGRVGKSPDPIDVTKAGSKKITQFRKADIEYDANKWNRALDNAIDDAGRIDRIKPAQAQKAVKKAAEFRPTPSQRQANPGVTGSVIVDARKAFGNLKGKDSNRKMAQHLKRATDEFASNPSNALTGPGVPPNMSQRISDMGGTLRAGNRQFHQGSKGEEVANLLKKTSSATRAAAQKLWKKVKRNGMGYTEREKELLKDLAEGRMTTRMGERIVSNANNNFLLKFGPAGVAGAASKATTEMKHAALMAEILKREGARPPLMSRPDAAVRALIMNDELDELETPTVPWEGWVPYY